MRGDKILHPETDPLVEEEIKVIIEEITIIEIIIDQIIEIHQEADGTTIGQVIEVVITQITIDRVTLDQTTDKTPNGLFENRSQSRNRSENYDTRGRSRDRNQRHRGEFRSRSNSRVSTN